MLESRWFIFSIGFKGLGAVVIRRCCHSIFIVGSYVFNRTSKYLSSYTTSEFYSLINDAIEMTTSDILAALISLLSLLMLEYILERKNGGNSSGVTLIPSSPVRGRLG
jgi:hypothetical protein